MKYGRHLAPCTVGLVLSAVGTSMGKLLIVGWETPVGRFGFMADTDSARSWGHKFIEKADELDSKPAIQVVQALPPQMRPPSTN